MRRELAPFLRKEMSDTIAESRADWSRAAASQAALRGLIAETMSTIRQSRDLLGRIDAVLKRGKFEG